MATKAEINSLIAESMSEMNETRSEKIPLGKLGSVVLYGEWGVFDSLQLVNFLMNLEEKISDKLDLSLSLTSDRAVSRKISLRSDLRIARCPPLRSAAVRRQISAAYGAPVVANQPAIVAFGAAPRLSEFDTEA